MQKTLEILEGFPGYYMELRFDFHMELKDWVKNLPGVKSTGAWNQERKTWRVPASYKEVVKAKFEAAGFRVTREAFRTAAIVHEEDLRPWQNEGIQHALLAPGQRFIFGFVTGAGKTATALRFCKFQGAQRILVVCPGSVKYTWKTQQEKWWPEAPHLELIEYGRERKLSKKKTEERDLAYQAPFQVVSYDMAHEVAKKGWDVIIFDECHMLQWPTSRQSQACYELSKYNPHASVLGLTATLAPTEPMNLFGPLHVIQPDAWGKPEKKKKQYPSFEFCRRYMNGIKGEYGWTFEGVNEVHEGELRQRLATCFMRVTEEDIRDHIPAVSFDVLRVPRKNENVVREWAAGHGEPCVIFTWYRETAERYAAALGGRHVHGEMDAKKREVVIEDARRSGVPLCATMSSAGIGIDLGFASRVLVAELTGRAEKVVQAVGRVMGMRRTSAAFVTFLVEDTKAEERKAWVLTERLQGIASGYSLGDAEKALLDVFDTNKLEDSLKELTVDLELMNLDFDDE